MFLRTYVKATSWLATAKERLAEERGATAVEYALMVALIAVVIIAAVTILGQNANSTFQTVADEVGAAGG
jgi:pilus assembly protein Flp/PilA